MNQEEKLLLANKELLKRLSGKDSEVLSLKKKVITYKDLYLSLLKSQSDLESKSKTKLVKKESISVKTKIFSNSQSKSKDENNKDRERFINNVLKKSSVYNLSEVELNFLKSIKNTFVLSEKQIKWYKEIKNKVGSY